MPGPVQGLQADAFRGVACGNFHALAVTQEGDVFAWGSNARGRLGLGKGTQKEGAFCARGCGGILVTTPFFFCKGTPVRIPRTSFLHHRVMSVGCGLHHSVFLLDNGTVYSAGCNEHGQLGRTKVGGCCGFGPQPAAAAANNAVQGFRMLGSSLEPEPVTLPFKASVVRVACGRHHVLALTTTGQLLAWGKNDVGQLGMASGRDVALPQAVAGAWPGVRLFDAGRNHSVVASTDDRVWVFGQNVDMQLGLVDRADRTVPVEVRWAGGGGGLVPTLTHLRRSWSACAAFACSRLRAGRARQRC